MPLISSSKRLMSPYKRNIGVERCPLPNLFTCLKQNQFLIYGPPLISLSFYVYIYLFLRHTNIYLTFYTILIRTCIDNNNLRQTNNKLNK